MLLITHPTGNVFVRALLEECENKTLDYLFFTSLAFQKDAWWVNLLPTPIRAEAARRSYPIPASRCRQRPWRELARLSLDRWGRHFPGQSLTSRFSVEEVYRDLDSFVAEQVNHGNGPQEIQAVYGYEDGCCSTFSTAKSRGITCAYELPIAYWKTVSKLLGEEAERLPAWEPTLLATRDSPDKLARKTTELQLADLVICPSRFVYDSLPPEITREKKVLIAEFGSPSVVPPPIAPKDGRRRPMRVLFAGSLTQRKGLADLFAAMKLINRSDVELIVMGTPVVPLAFYRACYPDFRYETTRPNHGVLQLMRACDVLALPSIVEGRALVQQEAMVCGLPILVTANAGGEDLVEPGQTGFVVPIRDPQAIAEKISWFADHRSSLTDMGQRAREKALAYTWTAYGSKIINALQKLAKIGGA